jgi:hypothetical protein
MRSLKISIFGSVGAISRGLIQTKLNTAESQEHGRGTRGVGILYEENPIKSQSQQLLGT